MSVFRAVVVARSSRIAPRSSLWGTFQWWLAGGGGFGGHGIICFQRKLNQVLWSRCTERKMYFKPCWECKSPNQWLGAVIWRTRLTLLWSKGANFIQWRCRGPSTDTFDPWVHSYYTHPKLDNSEKRETDRNPFLSLSLLWVMALSIYNGQFGEPDSGAVQGH